MNRNTRLQKKISLDEVKTNPKRVIDRVISSRDPFYITDQGIDLAVVQSVEEYHHGKEQQDFMKAVIKGLTDIEAENEISLKEVRQRLEIT